MITKELKDAWLVELRDPMNEQAHAMLFREPIEHLGQRNMVEIQSAVKASRCMCAMGCLIKAHAKLSTDKEYLHTQIQRALDANLKFEIIHMNDARRKSFEEIAKFVEGNVEAV